jgi:hypothetical protein
VFTPDGRYLLVGNYLDQDFSILRVNGTTITDTGKRFKVPGHPASARMSPLAGRWPGDRMPGSKMLGTNGHKASKGGRISRKSPKKRSVGRGFLQARHPGYG